MLAGIGAYTSIFGFGRFTYSLLLPDMQRTFGASHATMGALATTGLIGYTLGSAVASRIVHRSGPARTLLVALATLGVSLALLGATTRAGPAQVLMLLGGVAAGIAFVGLAVLLNVLGGTGRTTLVGIASGGIGLGTLLASGVSALLLPTSPSAWRSVWIVVGVLTVLGAVLLYTAVSSADARAAHDAVSAPPGAPPRARRGVAHLRRRHVIYPMYFAYGLGYFAYMTFINAFLQEHRGVSVGTSSMLFLLLGAASIPTPFLLGLVVRRRGFRLVLLLTALSPVLATVLTLSTSAPVLRVVAAVLFGGPVAGLPAMTVTYIGTNWDTADIPGAYAVLTVGFGIAQALAPALAGHLPLVADPLLAALYVALAALALTVVFAGALPSTRAGGPPPTRVSGAAG